MKTSMLAIATVAMALTLAFAGAAAPKPAETGPTVGNTPDDNAIRAVVAGMSAGWNAKDAHKMCADLAENVEWISWRGAVSYGHKTVEVDHEEEFKGIYKDTHREDTVKNIHYLAPGLASVDDFWTMRGAKTRDGADWPYRAGYINYLMSKQSGKWTILVSHTADFNAKAPATSSAAK